jgi:fumarylacetoacetase
MPLDHLRIDNFAFDIPLEVELNGEVVSRTNARNLYWNVAQQIAHLTSNGASLRTGDLLATGTISGAGERERGSLIELTWNEGPFLQNGDEVVLRGEPLGEVRGRLV